MRARSCGLAVLLNIVLVLAIVCRAAGSDEVALRCWRCGDIFTIPGEASNPRCPSCGAVCKREGKIGTLRLHCIGSGPGCSYIVCCPDSSTIVFAGSGGGCGEHLVERMREIGITEVDVLIGAETVKGCMRSLMKIMKAVPVKEFFDPGFRNEGRLYADFLDVLREQETTYRVVRAMENFTFGKARFFVMRPGSFNSGEHASKTLHLCVVHGSNSFVLSDSLLGNCSRLPRPRKSEMNRIPEFLLEGGTASLRAVASPGLRERPVVLVSDGREISVRSLRMIALSAADNESGTDALSSGRRETARSLQEKERGKGARINLNKASTQELEALSGIGIKKANMIVHYRESNGPFLTIEDIKKVPGIGEKIFMRNKEKICVK